jgi:hypothetical protein
MRRRKPKVFCAGCANLFILGGENPPMCMATAEFVSGPIRRKIDVKGVESAIRRNIRNDCEYRISVSLRAWELKRWLLWRLNDGSKKRIGEIGLREYPVKKEYDRKRTILGGDKEEAEEEIYTEEEISSEAEEKTVEDNEKLEEEGVFSDGGVDDHDESGAADKGGSEGI